MLKNTVYRTNVFFLLINNFVFLMVYNIYNKNELNKFSYTIV